MSDFSRLMDKYRERPTRHPRLAEKGVPALSVLSDPVSEQDYIVVVVGKRESRIRFVYEPETQTPQLPQGVTEVTVRREGAVGILHSKEVPSRLMALAAKHFGTPNQD